MDQDFAKQKGDSVLHGFDKSSSVGLLNRKFVLVLLAVILLGVGGGYLLTVNSKGGGVLSTSTSSSSSLPKGTIEGSEDTKTFRDTAEGVLEEGGIEGEGQYHLVRPGGESQYVYLTSSTVDLSSFLKKKVKVWGETNKGQKAGWLMDVGRVEVLQ